MKNLSYLDENRIHIPGFTGDMTDKHNGQFIVTIKGEKWFVIASSGMGWDHVSISAANDNTRTKMPSWNVMAKLKDMFFEDNETVVQIHPPKTEYVNNMPNCLHLWRPNDGKELPLPPSILTGIKGITPKDMARMFGK